MLFFSRRARWFSVLLVTLGMTTAAAAQQNMAALKKQAESGNRFAEFNLGVAYDSGQGVPRDYAQAAFWYRKAAELVRVQERARKWFADHPAKPQQ